MEIAELRKALEDAKVALAEHPSPGMDAALQPQHHQAMITALVGEGFGEERTHRRHVADWVERVKDAYPHDTRKQIAVGKGIMQRLSRAGSTGREEVKRCGAIEQIEVEADRVDETRITRNQISERGRGNR